VAVSRTLLVVINGTANLDGGRWLRFGKSPRQGLWQRRRSGRLWGEGAFGGFGSVVGQHALAATLAAVVLRHIGIVDGAVVPVVGVPLGQDAVGVMAIDMRSRALATPMAHAHAVETEPFRCCIRTHHVMWTTPSDDNCRRAVDGT
jgi:hypothetical protein